jgi:hypothetical protein
MILFIINNNNITKEICVVKISKAYLNTNQIDFESVDTIPTAVVLAFARQRQIPRGISQGFSKAVQSQ